MARLLLLCSVVIVLSGCGGSTPAPPAPTPVPEADKPADQIVSDARSALATVSSVHIVGSIKIGSHRDTFDIIDSAGGSGQGTVTMDRVLVDAILVGDVFYVHGQTAVAQFEPSAVVRCVGDRWVVPPVAAGYAPIQRFFDLVTLGEALLSPISGVTPHVELSTVRGLPAIRLTADNGRDIFVANLGPPLPLRITRTTATDTGLLDFIGYGAATSIVAPTGSVDMSSETSKCVPAGAAAATPGW